jgi:catechol 2,3-dioxygenase-like lactoylglutathione lyase family enzyme
VKLTRVTIKARDYRKSCDFYKNALGLRMASSWQRKDSWGALFSAGPADIEIIWYPESSGLEDCNYIPQREKFEVFLEVHDIDIVYRRLSVLGLEMVGPPGDTPWGFRKFTIKDPDNIPIVIIQPVNR